MKLTGYLMLIGGFLAASYATALDTQLTDWAMFLPSGIVSALGVLIIKRQASGEARAEHVLTANRAELTQSIGNIASSLRTIVTDATPIRPELTAELRERIDRTLRDDLRRFADARESMIHLFGIQAYANIMSEFAAGERYINRVWSASADGYNAEAHAYLQKAVTQFEHAQAQLAAADTAPPRSDLD